MSKIVKAANVTISSKKLKLNAPEQEEEILQLAEEEGMSEEELLHLEEMAGRKVELENIEIIREQIISEANNEASRLLFQAKTQSAKILEDAEKEGKSVKDNVIEEARKEGYNAGVKDGKAEGDKLAQEGKKILEEAKATRHKLLDNLEPEILELVVNITDKLLHDTARFKKDTIIYLIRAGLSDMMPSDELKIRVSPDDYEAVIDDRDELLKLIEGGTKLEIIKDLSLNKSDCIIETSYGYIDSSLGQQFEALKENLYYISKHGDME